MCFANVDLHCKKDNICFIPIRHMRNAEEVCSTNFKKMNSRSMTQQNDSNITPTFICRGIVSITNKHHSIFLNRIFTVYNTVEYNREQHLPFTVND